MTPFFIKNANLFRIYLFVGTIFLFAFIYYMVADKNDFHYLHKNSTRPTFVEALHYSAIVQSTVGLGQISPKSPKMMNLTTIQALTTPFIFLS